VKTYLAQEEIRLLEEAATNLRDRLLVRLLFHLGCRVSEALALKVEDVDFDQGAVTIQHLKTRARFSCPHCGARLGRTHTFCPECGTRVEKVVAKEQEQRRVRTLPIDDDTSDMLRDYIKRGGPICQKGKLLEDRLKELRAISVHLKDYVYSLDRVWWHVLLGCGLG